jgi:adenylate cyclase
MSNNCPSCGARVPEQFKFCGFCGEKLAIDDSSAPVINEAEEPRGARRTITILFADLTNSTTIAETRDPESVFLLLRGMLEKLVDPIKRYGGSIDRYIGDGLMATFGAEEAHEDDPTRAMLTALEMQAIMDRLTEKARDLGGWDVRLRVGISTGEAVVGAVETGDGLDSSVYGHNVNLGARLQSAARKGTILVSDSVYRKTQAQFEFKAPVTLSLKGIAQEVVGYELVGERSDPQPVRGLSGRRAPNVGRNREYEQLAQAIQRTRFEGQGMLALVTGEAGIGKSRLVDEVVNPLDKQLIVIQSAATPYNLGAYALFTGLIENLVGINSVDAKDDRLRKVNAYLERVGSLGREIGPALKNFLQLEHSDSQVIVDPEILRQQIITAVRRLLMWLGRRDAVLLVLDDIHWADKSSLQAIELLVDLINELPISIIALAREEIFDDMPGLVEVVGTDIKFNFLDVRIDPLSADNSDRLVRYLLPELDVPREASQAIYGRTNGNPLLIEELIRTFLDLDVVIQRDSRWSLAESWRSVVQTVPETITGLMLARYDRLSTDLKRILDMACILGFSFSLRLLSAVTQVELSQLRPFLRTLENEDFLRRVDGGEAPHYLFRHALMQESIENTLLQEARRDLHLRAADAIRQDPGLQLQDEAAVIAYHLEAAQSPEAVTFLLQAGKKASERFANPEALDHYARVQRIIESREDSPDELLDATLNSGIIYWRMGQFESALSQLNTAQEIAETLSNAESKLAEISYRLGLANVDAGRYETAILNLEHAGELMRLHHTATDMFTQADIEREVGWVRCFQGELEKGNVHAARSLELAEAADNQAALGSAYNLLAAVNYWQGNFQDSLQNSSQALDIRNDIGDIWGSASSQNSLGTLYHKLGQWTQAEALLRQAIYVQQEIGDYQTLPLTWSNLALLLLDSGRLPEALQSADEAVGGLPEMSEASSTSIICHVNRGLVKLRIGMLDGARADLEHAVHGAETSENAEFVVLALTFLAESHLETDLEQARHYLDQVALQEDSITSPEVRAELLRVRSRYLIHQQEFDQGIAVSESAQNLYLALGSDYEVARCRLETAEELMEADLESNRRFKTVRGLTEAALKTFREFENRPARLKAERLLQQFNERDENLPAIERPFLRMLVRFSLHSEPNLTSSDKFGPILDELVRNFHRLGQEHFITVSRRGVGFSLLFTATNPEDPRDFFAQSLSVSQDVLDEVQRINKVRKEALGVTLVTGLGVSTYLGRELLRTDEDRDQFLWTSPAAKQAEYAAALAGDFETIIVGSEFLEMQSRYELESLDASAELETGGPTFRLVRVKSENTLPFILPGSSPGLIGRDRERWALKDWLRDQRTQPTGGIGYIEAQAGMGKTRLLEEFLPEIEREFQYFYGKCESYRRNVSYSPLIDLLQRELQDKSPEIQRLRGLLGLVPPDEHDELFLASMEPEALRKELFGRFREFILSNAHGKPVLLIIEDIHWLDLSSQDLLDFLSTLTQEYNFSLLLLARSEMPGPHRELIAKSERRYADSYLEIVFQELQHEEQTLLLESLLDTKHLPTGLSDLMVPFLGHPLSVEEAVRYLTETHVLWWNDGRWYLDAQAADALENFPSQFTDLLFKRLECLDNETLHVLHSAAVLGETFDRKILSHMVPDPGLLSRLTELEDRRWLIPQQREQFLEYRFRHTLTRETIYSTLFKSKQQLLHQRAGEAFEQLYPEAQESNAELVAHHFAESGLRDKSVHYSLRAAEKSFRRSATSESLLYYQRVEKILSADKQAHPAMLTRYALGLADLQLSKGESAAVHEALDWLLDERIKNPSLELLIGTERRRAAAFRDTGDHKAALREYEKAVDHLSELGKFQQTRQADTETTHSEQLQIHMGLAQTYFDMRQNDKAKEYGQRVLASDESQSDLVVFGQAANLIAGIAFRSGDLEQAIEMLNRCVAIYQQMGNRAGLGTVYSNLGLIEAAQQAPDEAHDQYMLSLNIQENLGNANGVTVTRNNLALLEKNRQNYPAAMEHFSRAADTARRHDFHQLLTQILANLGQTYSFVGRTNEAIELFREGEKMATSYDYGNLRCEIYWKWAESYLENGQLSAAREIAEAASALAKELNSNDLHSESLRMLARAHRREGHKEEALTHAFAAWHLAPKDRDPLVRSRFAAEYSLALVANDSWPEGRDLFNANVREYFDAETPSMRQELQVFP